MMTRNEYRTLSLLGEIYGSQLAVHDYRQQLFRASYYRWSATKNPTHRDPLTGQHVSRKIQRAMQIAAARTCLDTARESRRVNLVTPAVKFLILRDSEGFARVMQQNEEGFSA